MKNNVWVLLTSAIVMMLVTSSAIAQFGGFGGGGDRGSDGSLREVIDSFSKSQAHVIDAQIHLSEAFDLRDHVTLLQAEKAALESGGMDGDVRARRKEISDNASRAISDVMAQEPELTAESRAHYTNGLVSYVQGLYHAKQTVDKAGNVSGSGGLGMAASAEARQGAAIAREAPSYLRDLQGTTGMLVQYAQRNGIEIPPDATAMLDGL